MRPSCDWFFQLKIALTSVCYWLKSSLHHRLSKLRVKIGPIERFHSVLWELNDKGRGSHVGVPKKKLIKIILYGDTNMAAMTSCENTLFVWLFFESDAINCFMSVTIVYAFTRMSATL